MPVRPSPVPPGCPGASNGTSGATPEASLALLWGQWATATSKLPVEVDVGLGQPDAVGGQHPPVQHPGPGQHGRDRVPVLVGEAAALLLGLGQVDVEEGVELPRSFGDMDQPGSGTV